MNSNKVLSPQYFSQFTCIGGSCEDTCCAGWRVTIDRKTYKKYQNIKGDQAIKKNVKRVRKNITEHAYAELQLGEKNECKLLTDDGLCGIQVKYGEDFLSHTCSSYPRTVNKVDDSFEKSATVSCPEIARLVLLNPKGIEFDEIHNSEKVLSYNNKIDSKSDVTNPKKYFWDLRIFTIEILQNRDLDISNRLIILGLFYKKLNEIIDNKELSNIPNTIQLFKELMSNKQLNLTEISSDLTVQLDILYEIINKRITSGVSSERYLKCFREMLLGLDYSESISVEELSNNYKDIYNNYYLPFMANNEYILENYLVNYVFKNLFPFGNYTNVFEEYVMLVVHFSLIKTHLIGISGYYKSLNYEIIVAVIQTFSKTVEHNNIYLQQILKMLKNNNYVNLPYMTILVKN